MSIHDRHLFLIAVVAVAAVGLICYQHALHTGQIVGAIANAAGAPTALSSSPASLAGMPTPGQSNLVPQPQQAVPLTTGAGWTVH